MFRVVKLYKSTSDPTPWKTLLGYGVNQYEASKCTWGIGWRDPMVKKDALKLLGELSNTTQSMEFSFEPSSSADNVIWSYFAKMHVYPNIALISDNVSFTPSEDITIDVRVSNSLPPSKVILSRAVL